MPSQSVSRVGLDFCIYLETKKTSTACALALSQEKEDTIPRRRSRIWIKVAGATVHWKSLKQKESPQWVCLDGKKGVKKVL
jgi:hypothetical protein